MICVYFMRSGQNGIDQIEIAQFGAQQDLEIGRLQCGR